MSSVLVSEELIKEVKEVLIKSLRLELSAERIGNDEPLFVEGLGLDSVDAIEIVVGLENHFNIQLRNDQFTRDDFQSVSSLANLVQRLRTQQNV